MDYFATAKTPLFLQEALAAEIRTLTAGMRFFKAGNNERTAELKVYTQNLPKLQKEQENQENLYSIDYTAEMEEDAVRDCPWCVVKIDSGSVPGPNEKQHVTMAVQFASYDNRPENQGHKDIMNLIFLLYMRFAKNPVLDRQYTFTGKIDWSLGDEDVHPYFTGAAVLEFEFTGIRRESRYT